MGELSKQCQMFGTNVWHSIRVGAGQSVSLGSRYTEAQHHARLLAASAGLSGVKTLSLTSPLSTDEMAAGVFA